MGVYVNIGSEIDGKNEYFERPVLIVRKMNGNQFFGAPLTSKEKVGKYYVPVVYGTKQGALCLSQFKTFSSKRLLRKIDTIEKTDFLEVKKGFTEFFMQCE